MKASTILVVFQNKPLFLCIYLHCTKCIYCGIIYVYPTCKAADGVAALAAEIFVIGTSMSLSSSSWSSSASSDSSSKGDFLIPVNETRLGGLICSEIQKEKTRVSSSNQ